MNCTSFVPYPLVLGLAALLPRGAAAQEGGALSKSRETAKPIAFQAVDRTIGKLPKLTADDALYGLLLFGLNGEHRVWCVLDRSAAKGAEGDAGHDAADSAYDVLYIDRNADGDLTGEGERIAASKTTRSGAKKENISVTFDIGDFQDPGSQAIHKDFQITWTKASVRIAMKWRGMKKTFGVYGPERETYQNFAKSPKEAPILVPGYDRPFEFEHWMSGVFTRGKSTDFKVFVGNRGDRRGTFVCVDDKFLEPAEYVDATLIYADTSGKEQRYHVKLTERC
mgnify:CR=1 FL=1